VRKGEIRRFAIDIDVSKCSGHRKSFDIFSQQFEKTLEFSEFLKSNIGFGISTQTRHYFLTTGNSVTQSVLRVHYFTVGVKSIFSLKYLP
jgi:hypothetical protein